MGRRTLVAFALASLLALCAWGFACMFQSLGPSMVIRLLGIGNRAIATAIVCCFLGTSAVVQLRLRGWPTHRATLVGLTLIPVGLALVIVSVIPALVAIAALVRRRRRPRVRRSARAVRHDQRASLEAVRHMDVDTIEGRRAVFAHVDALVREHLRDLSGVPGPSLTPNEVPFALAGRPTNVPAELVASVLSTCELALYAPAHAMPSAGACRETIERVAQIIEGHGRRSASD
jgi:hypothetical protein